PPAHEAALGLLRDHGPALRALLAEHEALLRRVADAPVAVAGAAPGRFYYAGADTIEHGQRVRILAEPGEVGS
ncbi:MAG TPA: hypothetical protein VFS82_01395, partial [Lysobacter sp.]|nr:hypothetical protein [Lysobacter sp.]